MGDKYRILTDLAAHGYLVLFGGVAAESLGGPVPAMPILLLAGVLTATGRLTSSASLVFGDIVWYGIGRKLEGRVLRRPGRISFGPETCRQGASDSIARYGGRTMLIAKFLPGIGNCAVAVAAASGIFLPAFLLYEIPGRIIYICTWLLLGRMLGHGIERPSRLAPSRMAP